MNQAFNKEDNLDIEKINLEFVKNKQFVHNKSCISFDEKDLVKQLDIGNTNLKIDCNFEIGQEFSNSKNDQLGFVEKICQTEYLSLQDSLQLIMK